MGKYSTLLYVTLICVILVTLEVPRYLVNEGWSFLIILSLIWTSFLIYRYSEFKISKAHLLALLVAAYFMVMLPLSQPLPYGLMSVFRALILLVFCMLIYTSLADQKSRLIWENSLILIGIFVGLATLFEVIFWYRDYLFVLSRIKQLPSLSTAFRSSGFLFIHPNVLAGYMNFIWPIMLIRMFNSKHNSERLLWIAGIALCALNIYFAISRGGLIGAFTGVIYLSLKPLFKYISLRSISKESAPSHYRQSLKQVLAGSLLLVLFAMAVLWRAIGSGQFNLAGFGSRYLLTLIDSLSSGRGTLWKYSWEAFLQSPIYGHGNGSFPLAYLKAANLPPGFFALSAHNLWLNVLVEYGLIGFGLLNFLLIVFFLQIKNYLSIRDTTRINFPDAYIAAVLAFLSHHLVDSMLWVTNYLASLLIIIVLMIYYAFPLTERKISRKYFLLLIMSLMLPSLLCVFLVSRQIAPKTSYSKIANLSQDNNHFNFQNAICSLANRFDRNALYQFQCSLVYMNQLSDDLSQPVDQSILGKALDYQLRGYSLDPHWPIQKANLAVLYWLKMDKDTALNYMRKAAEAAPRNPMIWLNLGWMEEKAGNQESAIEAYEHVIRLNPLLLNSIYFEKPSLFREMSNRLKNWMTSEDQWDSWYEIEILDKDFWRGLMALSLGENEIALENFDSSSLNFKPTRVEFYAYYAYTIEKSNTAYASTLAQDIALYDVQRIQPMDDPLLLSIIGAILHSNHQEDEAYRLFLKSYEKQNQLSDILYYQTIHGQQAILNDLSPLLIRSFYILMDTQDDWEWFVQQAQLREDEITAKKILRWKNQLNGLDGLQVGR